MNRTVFFQEGMETKSKCREMIRRLIGACRIVFAAAVIISIGPAPVRADAPPAVPFARRDKLTLRAAPNARSVPRFGKLELTLDLTATYDNPFDPDDIAVEAVFTAPSGKMFSVPGFLDQLFTRRLDNSSEILTPMGKPVWKVRFAPDTPGVWHYHIWARDRSGAVHLPETEFRVTPSANPGFVQCSHSNPRAFAFRNGEPFFAIGENMGWAGKRGSFDYDTWLGALGKAGGNWARVWMSNWNCGLEWSPQPGEQSPENGYHGLGIYNLAHAWMLDTILDAAARNHIYIMVCLGTYSEFSTGGFFNEGQWKSNPYNAANGGPCAMPTDFWTNERARTLYRHRLRYIMARYGWRTEIQAWEFWNEAHPPARWVEEMARALKGSSGAAAGDPYGHLLTTTYGDGAIWKIPEIDFTQTHLYGDTGDIADHAPLVARDARQFQTYDKPHLMGEFGIDWRASDSKYDPSGRAVNLHNSLWSAAVSGDAGGAMVWWWDSYVHPKNLYSQFTALRRFTDTVPWTTGPWQPLTLDPPHRTGGQETFHDLTLQTDAAWGKAGTSTFHITPSGLAGDAAIPCYLYSPGKAELRTTPTFQVCFTQKGQFIVHINDVSNHVTVRLLLDDHIEGEMNLDATPPHVPGVKPEYESTRFRPEYSDYEARYNKDYAIDVPAGPHRITLEAVAGDWASIGSITMTRYRSSRYPEINMSGIASGRTALLWVQNAFHNWKNVAAGKPLSTLCDIQTTLHGLPDGHYRIEWWDTGRGKVTGWKTAVSAHGALLLHLPTFTTDVAARILPQ